MKGKVKNKKKLIKTLLLVMSFVLVAVITAGTTLAWFYDSDWANKTVTMAGAVGIEMRDGDGATHGTGKFHFEIDGTKAYPGQGVEVQASVFNNGGSSIVNYFKEQNKEDYTDTEVATAGKGADGDYGVYGTTPDKTADNVGSPCYLRARFVVYTNIGTGLTKAQAYTRWPNIAPSDWKNDTSKDEITSETITEPTVDDDDFSTLTDEEINEYWTKHDEYLEYVEYFENKKMNATAIYTELISLIAANNKKVKDDSAITDKYAWIYWANPTPVMTLNEKTYLDGAETSKTNNDTDIKDIGDGGYFYLCKYDNSNPSNILKPLNVGETSAFLWDGTFVIPWQLNNAAADKTIFVALEFQAIQTYIPYINDDFKINGNKDNQMDAKDCTITETAVQTVFNSSKFTSLKQLTMGSKGIVYSDEDGFERATTPLATDLQKTEVLPYVCNATKLSHTKYSSGS